MTRVLTVVAATAIAAAVAAALTLPAGAEQSQTGTDAIDAKFVTCLRAQGLGIPADTRGDEAIKSWIVAHQSDPAVEPAVRTCKSRLSGDVSPTQLVACLRDHGLTPPARIDQLKPWIAGQSETDAGSAALHACGIDARPTEKPGPGGPDKQPAPCGGDAAPAPKPEQNTPELQDQ
jgi:hypothetical protein